MAPFHVMPPKLEFQAWFRRWIETKCDSRPAVRGFLIAPRIASKDVYQRGRGGSFERSGVER